MFLAPIVLVTCNRPNIFRTIDAMEANQYTDKSNLMIFCEVPRLDADKQDVNNARHNSVIIVRKAK